MNDAKNWVEQDLLQLIKNEVQENTELDYKACGSLQNADRKKTEISKDVSALANSAGGVIVYGIIEKGHVPVSIDEGYDPNEITKEWLEQVINSRIQQKINGITINPVELNTTNAGRVAYVVIVPQSSRAPHQASDKRFYKRYNFESAPMEEYEIRDVSHRHNAPLLSIEFHIEDISTVNSANDKEAKPIKRLKIMPLIENNSPVPAEYIAINFFIDKSVKNTPNCQGMTKEKDTDFLFSDINKECHRFYVNHAIPSKIPIFKGSAFKLLESPIMVDIDIDSEYYFAYTLLAPYMGKVTGSIVLKATDTMVSIHPL